MWNLIRKDLIRRWRAPASTLAMLLFPLFMSGMIGLISGGGGGDEEFPVVKVLLEDRDDSWLTRLLKGGLGREEVRRRLDVVEVGAEGRALMERGEASALVVIPAAFTDSLLAGAPVTLEVVRNPAEGIKPEIVEQGVQALSTYLDQAQRLLGEQLREVRRLTEFDRVPPTDQVGRLAESFNERMRSFERYLFPPALKVKSEKRSDEQARPNSGSSAVYGYVLVMTTIMALLFVTARAVGDLFDERKSGMLRRTVASPADVRLIVGAKYAAGVALGLAVTAILAALGFAFRWLRPPIDPLGAVLLIAAFSLAGCGLMGLVFSLVRTERQAGLLSWLVIMGNSALGGSMVPVENMPAPMRALTPYTLNYWAIDGFKELVFGGASTAGIARHLLVLGAAGAALAAAGWAVMVRRSREMSA